MDSAVSLRNIFRHDFDPNQLTLRVRVTLAADRKSRRPRGAAK